MGYRKIKLKETHHCGSLKNKFFRIDKGQIITVEDHVNLDLNVFDIVEQDGKVLIKLDKFTDVDIERLLKDNEAEAVLKTLKEEDPSFNDIKAILEAEAKGRKRKVILRYLMEIPEATDKGIKFGKKKMWLNELMAIKVLSQRDAMNIMTVYPNKEALLLAFRDQQNIPFESKIEDGLRKAFDFEKKKKVVAPKDLDKARAEMIKKSNVGATTMDHFKFLKKEKK